MKKIIYLLILISISISAQNFSGLKFYINPGHGGNNPANDRYIPETGFWESEGNLTKGLYFRDQLLRLNAQVVMSRTTNFESDDRALSLIAAEANANNVDFFHSIHSNATGTVNKANYALMLFRGYDTQPVFTSAKTMSQIMYSEITAANRTVPWSNGVRGDWSFYPDWGDKVGLGVLRTLTMPGVLSEGSFHDYIPESFRLTNTAYRHNEAVSFLRSFIKLYNKEPLPYGTVAGIARDLTKDINFTWLSSLPNDKKKPINEITVRLEPGGRTFYGDNKNNGFFFFDSVYPGTYKLYITAEGYNSDSAEISVAANKPHFKDFFLLQNADPKVSSFSPSNPEDSIRINTPIVIKFNTAMNTKETEAAIGITPDVDVVFEWQDYDQVLTIRPVNLFQPATLYNLIIDTTAVNKFDINIDSVLSFNFITDQYGQLNVEASYPNSIENNDISTTLQIQITFNYPLSMPSISNNIFVEDSSGNRNPIIRGKIYEENGKGKIKFELKNKLENNTDYFLVLNGDLKSYFGIEMVDTLRIKFKTEQFYSYLEQTLDQFDSTTAWIPPVESVYSFGIDSAKTNLTKATDRVVSGNSSAKLTYVFTSESGRVDFSLGEPLSLSENSIQTRIGIWVFGDLSKNILFFNFKDSKDSLINVQVDSISWTGWKLIYLNLDDLPTLYPSFIGLSIKKNIYGLFSGEIYFDDLSAGLLTGTDNEVISLPNNFELYQNYPNPFNPTTTIEFSIPESYDIYMTIYNSIGEKVRTLIDGQNYSSGRWTIVWDGNNDFGNAMPSGIYYYRLRSETFSLVKKMILLK